MPAPRLRTMGPLVLLLVSFSGCGNAGGNLGSRVEHSIPELIRDQEDGGYVSLSAVERSAWTRVLVFDGKVRVSEIVKKMGVEIDRDVAKTAKRANGDYLLLFLNNRRALGVAYLDLDDAEVVGVALSTQRPSVFRYPGRFRVEKDDGFVSLYPIS